MMTQQWMGTCDVHDAYHDLEASCSTPARARAPDTDPWPSEYGLTFPLMSEEAARKRQGESVCLQRSAQRSRL